MRTYGTLELEDGHWIATVEPHVSIRLKRVFARVGRSTVGPIKLKATDEVSSELHWFMQRFPLRVKGAALARLERQARQYSDDLDAFDKLVTGASSPQSFSLAIEPREYQRVAASLWLRARGLLVADDVGLGKTATAICGLSEAATRPALVVTLTHLPTQWEREIKRFCPQLTTHRLKKSTPYDVRIGAGKTGRRQAALFEPTFPDVLICNYHKLAGWADSLAGVVKSIVFDECQELRHAGDSQKYAAAEAIAEKCDYRLGLSATPIYNYGYEFFNVLRLLRPDALGTSREFLTEWCTQDGSNVDKSSIRDPRAFGVYLRESALMLRRTRKDVGRELPALSRSVQHCETEHEPLKAVETAATELARIILSQDSSWHARGEATREIDWKLRQATGLAKAPHVVAFVRLLVESGERVVLYGWHRAVYDVWLECLKDLQPMLFTGSESPAQKEKAREAFCSGDSQVLIMSLRSGAGLDGLQKACRTVVFGELDWSPGVHEQCEGRVFRDGQPDPVTVFYLVAEDGSDPVVSDVLGLKRGQIEGVRDPNAELVERLDGKAEKAIRALAERYLARKHKAPPAAREAEASGA